MKGKKKTQEPTCKSDMYGTRKHRRTATPPFLSGLGVDRAEELGQDGADGLASSQDNFVPGLQSSPR